MNLPASDELVAQIRGAIEDRRNHDHSRTRDDYYCLNLVAYMGERMEPVLHRLAVAEAEVERLRAVLESVAMLADPTVERVGRDHNAARLRDIHDHVTRALGGAS